MPEAKPRSLDRSPIQARRAVSRQLPHRRSAPICSSSFFVSKYPGANALTLIRLAPHSGARARVMFTTAPFDVLQRPFWLSRLKRLVNQEPYNKSRARMRPSPNQNAIVRERKFTQAPSVLATQVPRREDARRESAPADKRLRPRRIDGRARRADLRKLSASDSQPKQRLVPARSIWLRIAQREGATSKVVVCAKFARSSRAAIATDSSAPALIACA